MSISGVAFAVTLLVFGDGYWESGVQLPKLRTVPLDLVAWFLGMASVVAGAVGERLRGIPLQDRLKERGLLPRGLSARGCIVGLIGAALLAGVSLCLIVLGVVQCRSGTKSDHWEWATFLQCFAIIELACLFFTLGWVGGEYAISRRWPAAEE